MTDEAMELGESLAEDLKLLRGKAMRARREMTPGRQMGRVRTMVDAIEDCINRVEAAANE